MTTNYKKAKALLAISFAPGFISPNIPIATFKQKDKELNFIIDTGSDHNVIDKDALSSIEHVIDKDKLYDLTGLGVTGENKVKTCDVTFQYEEDTFTEAFLISDLKGPFSTIKQCHAIPLHGMLGSNFLKKNNLILDFNNLIAYNK